MHRSLVYSFLRLSLLVSTASAEPPQQPALLGGLHGVRPLLVGGFGGGHSRGLGAPYGWFLGAETGWAWLVGSSDGAARTTSAMHDNAWCFGARSGYQLRSGLAIQARFDRLGVSAPDGSGELVVASAGVRYSVPIVPMPFAEALVGPAFHGASTSPAVSLGVGASVLVARHASLDASVRDWIVDLGGVHHIPTLMFGITAGFGG